MGPLSDVARLVAIAGGASYANRLPRPAEGFSRSLCWLLSTFGSVVRDSVREFETGLGQAAFARALDRVRVENARPLDDDNWAGSPDLARELRIRDARLAELRDLVARRTDVEALVAGLPGYITWSPTTSPPLRPRESPKGDSGPCPWSVEFRPDASSRQREIRLSYEQRLDFRRIASSRSWKTRQRRSLSSTRTAPSAKRLAARSTSSAPA